jgi:hypothetical protein
MIKLTSSFYHEGGGGGYFGASLSPASAHRFHCCQMAEFSAK